MLNEEELYHIVTHKIGDRSPTIRGIISCSEMDFFCSDNSFKYYCNYYIPLLKVGFFTVKFIM